MKPLIIFASLLLLLSCGSPQEQGSSGPDLGMNNLYAWCIVPFDALKRSPEQRVAMLKELGFSRYVYDWRAEHLPEMAREWQLAREAGIEVMGVWLWIDATSDQAGQLSAPNEQVLQALAQEGLKTQLWLGFHGNYFEGLPDTAAVEKGVEMIDYLHARAEAIGCRLALYNHGDWFGEPENQVRIIEALPGKDIGIVYNFHHGHHQIDRFSDIVQAMRPYLWAVSLNGMKRDGPKILPIGQGEEEKKMIGMLHEAGFRGPYGVLGHVDDADVRDVLKTNLAGLNDI